MRKLSSVSCGIAVMIWLASLTGCQTVDGVSGLTASAVTAEMTPESAKAISDDLIAKFSEQIGPGKTTIRLHPDGSGFGTALETSLREWGYAIVTDQETGDTVAEPLAYSVSKYEGGVLVRLSSRKVELTGLYWVTETGAAPASPTSLMRRGSDKTS